MFTSPFSSDELAPQIIEKIEFNRQKIPHFIATAAVDYLHWFLCPSLYHATMDKSASLVNCLTIILCSRIQELNDNTWGRLNCSINKMKSEPEKLPILSSWGLSARFKSNLFWLVFGTYDNCFPHWFKYV